MTGRRGLPAARAHSHRETLIACWGDRVNETGDHASSVGRNFGGTRRLVACSNPYAIRISVGSLHGRPKNDSPTGRPKTYPAGTVMFGYPAIAAGDELPPTK